MDRWGSFWENLLNRLTAKGPGVLAETSLDITGLGEPVMMSFLGQILSSCLNLMIVDYGPRMFQLPINPYYEQVLQCLSKLEDEICLFELKHMMYLRWDTKPSAERVSAGMRGE